MGKRDDWFDSFMTIKMLEDDKGKGAGSGSNPANSGRLLCILVVLAIRLVVGLFK